MSVLIIYNISTESYSYSLNFISIASVSSFLVNILLMYLILKYTNNLEKYKYLLENIKCSCSCKNICSNKVQIEKNEEKDVYEAEKTVVF